MSLELTTLADFKLSIHPNKLTRYLLNPAHPKGGAKAAFFAAFGYTLADPALLEAGLMLQAWNAPTIKTRVHPLGYGIEIDAVGHLPTILPGKPEPLIKTA